VISFPLVQPEGLWECCNFPQGVWVEPCILSKNSAFSYSNFAHTRNKTIFHWAQAVPNRYRDRSPWLSLLLDHYSLVVHTSWNGHSCSKLTWSGEVA